MAHGRGTRMAKDWADIPGGPLILSATSTSIGGTFAFSGSATVMRLIGEYAIGTGATAPTALDEVEIGVGIGIFSTDAVGVGATAMPDPTDDTAFPWLYWADHILFFPTNTQTNASFQSSVRRVFDVKSMRRAKADESIAMIVQYTDVVGAPSVHVSLGGTRVLVAH